MSPDTLREKKGS